MMELHSHYYDKMTATESHYSAQPVRMGDKDTTL